MEIKKFGIIISLFLFTVVTFISGGLGQVNAASSSTVLPVAKGGTGTNTLSAGQALIGNGADSLQTKPIDTSPQSNSTNLITSGAVKTIADDATLAKGYDNTYFNLTGNTDGIAAIYLIGPVATKTSVSPEYTNFIGQLILIRNGSSGSIPYLSILNVAFASAYASTRTYAEITVQSKTSATPRTIQPITFIYNSVKYMGIHLAANGSASNNYLKGYLRTSLNCVSASALCTGKYLLPSEVSSITYL